MTKLINVPKTMIHTEKSPFVTSSLALFVNPIQDHIKGQFEITYLTMILCVLLGGEDPTGERTSRGQTLPECFAWTENSGNTDPK